MKVDQKIKRVTNIDTPSVGSKLQHEFTFKDKKITISPEAKKAYEDAMNPKLPFGSRIKRFFTAQSSAGRRFYSIADFALTFAPIPGSVSKITHLAGRFIRKDSKVDAIKVHKKKIFGIPLALICSYLGIEHNIISLTQTLAHMDFLTGSNFGWIISAILLVITIVQQISKNGLFSTITSISGDLDVALNHLDRARQSDSEGGKSVTKQELVGIIRSVFQNVDRAKKEIEKKTS